MNKILISLLVIGVVGGITVGLTTAYFSDTETSTGNTFTAGTIDITMDPTSGQQVTTVSGDLDLKPSQVGWTTSVITNAGTNPAEIWKSIENVENIENGKVEPEREYYAKYPDSVNWLMSNWIHYDMVVARPFYDTRNIAQLWTGDQNTTLQELDGELVVEVYYGCEKTLFKATAPSDYGNNGMMTFAFDMAKDGMADFQIQWEKGIGWRYSEVTGSKWEKDLTDWSEVPDKYTTGKDGRVYTLEIPTEDLGKKYKLGVDSNDQVDGNGQIFLSTDPEHIWYYDASYASSHWYVSMKVFKTIIEEEDEFYLSGSRGNGGVESHWIYLGELEPEAFMCVKQSYHLDSSVDNWAQSDRVKFEMDFMAQQTTPLPDPPQNVLDGHGR